VGDEPRCVSRPVLAVRVELDDAAVAALDRVAEARADGAAAISSSLS